MAKKFAKEFSLKTCLFGLTNIVINIDKRKYVYSSYGIVFNGVSSWDFCNKFLRKVVIFCVDSSLSSHIDNHNHSEYLDSKNDLCKKRLFW